MADSEVVTFSFGANWQAYLKANLSPETVRAARDDIVDWLGEETVRGRTVVDIGSGSGIHSLAFHQLGARELVSFDYDPNSVAATRSLWEQAGCPSNWRVLHGSVLDADFVRCLRADGGFDIVYSWGVLHHTGAMWRAVDLSATLVKPEGYYWIALYAKGPRYEQDLALKRRYNRAGHLGKRLMEAREIGKIIRQRVRAWHPRRVVSLARHGGLRELENPFAWNRKKERGMDVYHDIIDWLGGLPYEVASTEEVVQALEPKGFTLERVLAYDVDQMNNIYLFSLRGGAEPSR